MSSHVRQCLCRHVHASQRQRYLFNVHTFSSQDAQVPFSFLCEARALLKEDSVHLGWKSHAQTLSLRELSLASFHKHSQRFLRASLKKKIGIQLPQSLMQLRMQKKMPVKLVLGDRLLDDFPDCRKMSQRPQTATEAPSGSYSTPVS